MTRLTIGEIATRSRLSPKALRLYDRLGLLAPATVDPATGYRGYAVEQVERARLIALLRRIKMPLAEIGDLLAVAERSGREAAEELARYWDGVERGIAARRGVRVEPAWRLAATRLTKERMTYPRILGAYAAVEDWLRRNGEVIVAPAREVYPEPDWDGAAAADVVGEVAFPFASA
ncbi:MerR family transcriptional regulator [Streptomyces sp. NPDC053493]|uniref:MerR family transcriptional regulator n=1 Tax=Streptomyces sp. NPDC053493 TaxID=3365705 RepID=UPI0037D2B1D5